MDNQGHDLAKKIQSVADLMLSNKDLNRTALSFHLGQVAKDVELFAQVFDQLAANLVEINDRKYRWPDPDEMVFAEDWGDNSCVWWRRGDRSVLLEWGMMNDWCEVRRFAPGVGNHFGELVAMAGELQGVKDQKTGEFIGDRAVEVQERLDAVLLWLLAAPAIGRAPSAPRRTP